MSGISKIQTKLIVCSIYVFGMWYFCLRILGYQLEYIPGDLGDSRFINCILEHGYCWLNGKTNSFWTADFMFPFQNNIALSDPMIATQFFYSPWRFLGYSSETSYQLWWLCICSCNFWVAYWCFNKFFEDKLLAAILAWVFAFTVFNLGQLNHMQMIIRFPVPLAFFSAYKFISQQSLKYFCLYWFSILFQFYSVPYTGFYLFYFSLLFIFIYLFFTKRFRQTFHLYFNKDNLYKTLGVIAFSLLILASLLLHYANMSKTVGLRLYSEVLPNLPTLKSYLLVHESSLPWNFLFENFKTEIDRWWLFYLFPGMLLLGTLVYSIGFLAYKYFKKQSIPILLKSLIFVSLIISLLHLRISDNITLYGLIFKLPGINSMRVLNRFMHVEIFLLLLIFGFFIHKLNHKLFPLLFLLLIVDNSFDAFKIKRENKMKLVYRKEKLIRDIQKNKGFEQKTLVCIDSLNPAYITHLDAMLAAQTLGMKTINGYSSYCPDAYGDFYRTCSIHGLNKWITNQGLDIQNLLIINSKP